MTDFSCFCLMKLFFKIRLCCCFVFITLKLGPIFERKLRTNFWEKVSPNRLNDWWIDRHNIKKNSQILGEKKPSLTESPITVQYASIAAFLIFAYFFKKQIQISRLHKTIKSANQICHSFFHKNNLPSSDFANTTRI